MSEETRRQRLEEIKELRNKGIEPFPLRFRKVHNTGTVLEEYASLEASQTKEDEELSLAGRVMAIRHHGKSSFFTIRDESGTIQAYIRKDKVGDDSFQLFKKYVNIGDFIGIAGFPFKTHTGETSVFVKEFLILSKSIRTLPEKWHGLKDKETIYRQRYLEMISDEGALNRLKTRFRMISLVRRFLEDRGFVEVETPVLQFTTGGASARPFATKINVFDKDIFLRISEELYLKRYLVGGFERIFEIGKNFRNEGISYKHHPEFLMMELYQAYADYEDIMLLTEEMISEVVKELTGSCKLVYQGQEIDFTRPWKRVVMTDYIKDKLGIDILEDSNERLLEFLKEHDAVPDMRERGHLIEKLWDMVEDDFQNPTFVMDHPVIISPLAKQHPKDERVTQRFELIISGMECANAFSELNDPVEQKKRFLHQAGLREAGDAEAHMMDQDFIRALEFGMPPTGGLGIGWERIVMILTDSSSIRDIIAFPLVRPDVQTDSDEEIMQCEEDQDESLR